MATHGSLRTLRPMVHLTAEYLDEQQYTRASIEAYEVVYGPDFVSPGGERCARDLIGLLDLEPGERVLDIGCGLGGSSFLMAREAGASVEGIDLSRNMIAMAEERLSRHGLADRVRFRHGDCLELDGRDPYDALYSREVFLHIHDKPRLFSVLARALRPGGRLLFTDYCCSPPPWSEAFEAYVRQWGYSLHTPEEYAAQVASAGFVDVEALDRTDEFIAIHERELEALGEARLPEGKRRELAAGWQAKIDRARRGEQRWALFRARRPPP